MTRYLGHKITPTAPENLVKPPYTQKPGKPNNPQQLHPTLDLPINYRKLSIMEVEIGKAPADSRGFFVDIANYNKAEILAINLLDSIFYREYRPATNRK